MKTIKRIFDCEIGEDVGEVGFVPRGAKDADPYWSLTVAHDTLEHFPNDIGSIAGELRAIGAMLAIRGENGYFGLGFSEAISSDFVELARHFIHEGFNLEAPGRSRPVEFHADYELQRAVTIGLREVWSELIVDGYYEEVAEEAVLQFCRLHKAILGHMRNGYRAASNRYSSTYSAMVSFRDIVKAVDKAHEDAEEGDILYVEVNPDDSFLSVRLRKGWDEHGWETMEYA